MGEGKSEMAGPCSALRFMWHKGSSPVGTVSSYGFGAGALVASLPMGYACPGWQQQQPGDCKEGRKMAGGSPQPCVPSEEGWGAYQPLTVPVTVSPSSQGLSSIRGDGSPCSKPACWGGHRNPTSPAAGWCSTSNFYWKNMQIMMLPATSFSQIWKGPCRGREGHLLTPQTVLWACSKHRGTRNTIACPQKESRNIGKC